MNRLVLSTDDLIALNKAAGGTGEVRNELLLRAVRASAFGLGGISRDPLYSTVAGQAAALLSAVVDLHPFTTANTSTGLLAAMVWCRLNDRPVRWNREDALRFAEVVARAHPTLAWTAAQIEARMATPPGR